MAAQITDLFKNTPRDPFTLFDQWYDDAKKHEVNDPNAMALASVNYLGQPSVRMVLLKAVENNAFVFFTNLESRKAVEILDNPHVALCFHWKSLKRSIRIEGTAFKTTDEDADEYFSTRPLGSQIGAWASKQSRNLESRSVLEARMAEYAEKFGDGPVARPHHWSGFCVNPTRIEFWQERPFRLHDRFVYLLVNGEWETSRLYP